MLRHIMTEKEIAVKQVIVKEILKLSPPISTQQTQSHPDHHQNYDNIFRPLCNMLAKNTPLVRANR